MLQKLIDTTLFEEAKRLNVIQDGNKIVISPETLQYYKDVEKIIRKNLNVQIIGDESPTERYLLNQDRHPITIQGLN
jgi:hypothetical protein